MNDMEQVHLSNEDSELASEQNTLTFPRILNNTKFFYVVGHS